MIDYDATVYEFADIGQDELHTATVCSPSVSYLQVALCALEWSFIKKTGTKAGLGKYLLSHNYICIAVYHF